MIRRTRYDYPTLASRLLQLIAIWLLSVKYIAVTINLDCHEHSFRPNLVEAKPYRQSDILGHLCNNTGYLKNFHRLHKEGIATSHPRGLVGLLSLMLSGDIEINPGPVNEPMYPCAVCQLGVNWSHQAVACDVCDVWVHKSCASMDSTTYADIANHEWKCYGCRSTNVSSFLYHAFNVNVSNSFAPLAGIPGDDSIFLSSVLSPRSIFEPRVHSSPNTQTDMQTNPCTSTSTGCSSSASVPSAALDFIAHGVDNLRIAVLNAIASKGRNHKLQNSAVCTTTQTDILISTETKLDSSISSSEFLPRNFAGLIRKDRNIRGGGVMIAVRNNLVVDEVSINSLNSELICARISIVLRAALYAITALARSCVLDTAD